LNLEEIKAGTESSGKEAAYGLPDGNFIAVAALAPST
jgi:hypothetical protein